MGLSLTYQIFFGSSLVGLVPAYKKLYVERGELTHRRPQPAPEETWLYQEDGRINTWGKRGYNWREFRIHESDGWLVARPDLYVTEHCWVQNDVAWLSSRWGVTGMVVAVEDGDYWGYWLYERGRLTDQFCQEFERGLPGRPGHLAALLELAEADVAAYLLQMPQREDLHQGDLNGPSPEEVVADLEFARLNGKARPGDEFTRFSEFAVIDFLRLLRVPARLRNHCVEIDAPVTSEFWWRPWSLE